MTAIAKFSLSRRRIFHSRLLLFGFWPRLGLRFGRAVFPRRRSATVMIYSIGHGFIPFLGSLADELTGT
jgi:hypothetical protein